MIKIYRFSLLCMLCIFMCLISAFAEVQIETPESIYDIYGKFEPEFYETTDDSDASLMAQMFSGGSGTQDDPYILSTPNDLSTFARRVNTGVSRYTTAFYKLSNDIDLLGEEWTPVGFYSTETEFSSAFQGDFDGAGYTISNFNITVSSRYIGFFGLVYNADIKNLTLSDFTVNVAAAENVSVYAGTFAGQYISIFENENHTIENCHVKNASITVSCKDKSLYAGAFIGYFHSSEKASLTMTGCSTNADADFKVIKSSSYRHPSSSGDHTILRCGGMIGYTACVANGSYNINKSYSNSKIISENQVTTDISDNVHAGSFFGFVAAQDGSANVDECYASGSVFAEANAEIYAGAFSGYTMANSAYMTISNSHSTGNVYSDSSQRTSYISAFSGIAATPANVTNASVLINACYAFGDIVDVSSNSSEAGKITAYTMGNTEFVNCYSLKESVVVADAIFDSAETEISKQHAADLLNFTGFDPTIWIQSDSEYKYPVLVNAPFSDNSFSAYFIIKSLENPEYHFHEAKNNIGYAEYASPETELEKFTHTFSHFALHESGNDIGISNYPITADTVFFACYSERYETFTITLMAGGSKFKDLSVNYYSVIPFPTAPQIPGNANFRFDFSHWSKTEDGDPVGAAEIVKGDAVYYAVYTQVPSNTWDGSSSADFSGGTGTETDPYIISNASELYKLSQNVNSGIDGFSTAHYILTRDIDLGGHEWTPIGNAENNFKGTFNGDGYIVSNFKITEDTTYAGIFGYIDAATVKELGVTDFEISVTSESDVYAGGIAGRADATENNTVVKIEKCYTVGTITINAPLTYAGGIAGSISSTEFSKAFVENCFSKTDVSCITDSLSMSGGITGQFRAASAGLSYISTSYSDADISAVSDVAAYAAGICGFLKDDEWVSMSLQTQANLMSQSGNIRNCFALGSASANDCITSYAGNIYAYKNEFASISNCQSYTYMTVSATNKAMDSQITLQVIPSRFYTRNNLQTLQFDTDSIWALNSSALPTLKKFSEPKNIFNIDSFNINKKNGSFDAKITICYRERPGYLILAAAYDSRGKMIAFDTILVNDATQKTTNQISFSSLAGLEYCSISVIYPTTFRTIEHPIVLD